MTIKEGEVLIALAEESEVGWVLVERESDTERGHVPALLSGGAGRRLEVLETPPTPDMPDGDDLATK
eukprot:6766327-Prymnesium_polylepis.1